ncbi:MAG: c-type cytochrome [Candidatus Protistobacter heckmanni]|nr:c-type cytochrome [Candidatus Protistobacter heckmanni]
MRAIAPIIVVAAALAAGAAHTAEDKDPQARIWAASCATCHGTEGRAQAGFATLAGQPAAALTKQLLDFKTGRAPSTLMKQLTAGYDDEELARIADYFSRQSGMAPRLPAGQGGTARSTAAPAPSAPVVNGVKP